MSFWKEEVKILSKRVGTLEMQLDRIDLSVLDLRDRNRESDRQEEIKAAVRQGIRDKLESISCPHCKKSLATERLKI